MMIWKRRSIALILALNLFNNQYNNSTATLTYVIRIIIFMLYVSIQTKEVSYVLKDYKFFLDSIDSENTAKVAKSLSVIGEYDYINVTPVEIDHIILSTKPNSQKAITTTAYIMSMYAKYLGNEDMYYMLRNIDRNVLWLRAKSMASKKFISDYDFNRTCKEIEEHEGHNALYQRTLFKCIYEGLYSNDMSVLKNLGASDIQENIVTIKDDNDNEFQLEISDELAKDLMLLEKNNDNYHLI